MSVLNENRSHPRIDLFAQVQVSRESEVYIMSTINISRGGLFIVGDPAEYPELHKDIAVEIVIFTTDDLDLEDIRLSAKITRVDRVETLGKPRGFGAQFLPLNPQQISSLDRLIHSLSSESQR